MRRVLRAVESWLVPVTVVVAAGVFGFVAGNAFALLAIAVTRLLGV